MAEKTKLRIKSEYLGTVREVAQFLIDFENLYNSLLVFDLFTRIEQSKNVNRDKRIEQELRRIEKRYLKYRKDFDFPPYRYFFRDIFEERIFKREIEEKEEGLRIIKETEIDNLILKSDRLIITKVNIQSPGFWEFLGKLNPLEQIREYIKDCHERNKDKKYRNRQEEEKGDIEIQERQVALIEKKVDVLKKMGYSELEIRELMTKLINTPLENFTRHLNSGRIEGLENEEK